MAQQRSLNFQAKIVPDNWIALDNLLGEQGGICAVATTTYCIWINIFVEVKTQVTKDH